ncbi:methyl-accepting chemotaxis protein [uncultured Aquabacterium sp.]|uniref:methyl-accepting chemotaxis protein n=1 Tax=Aquabacterium sp. TaxID=1872578 RepID=UPI0025D2D151|nr:methyl-accepting chemotaxis protein [uncultured Aquabacterium sp.]
MSSAVPEQAPGWPQDIPSVEQPADKRGGGRVPRAPGVRGFFQYHGIWAPGIRLFRQLGFRAKALIISGAFLVPIGVLGVFFLYVEQQGLRFVQAERAGVSYARSLLGMLEATTRERQLANAAAQGELAQGMDEAAQQASRAAQLDLEAQHRDHGAVLKVHDQLQPVLDGLARARSAAAGKAPGAVDAFQAALRGQAGLLDAVVDNSNLALDPEIASYYMMDTVLIAAPDLALTAGRLRDQLVGVARAGVVQRTTVVEMDREAQKLLMRLAQIDTSLKKAGEAGRALSATALRAAVEGLVSLAADHVEGRPPIRDVQRITSAGDAAVQAGFALAQAGLPVLDELLADREQHDWRLVWLVSVITTCCVLGAGYLLYAFYRVTRGGMEEVRYHLVAMTSGDLTTSPRPWGRDEAASLMNTMADMQRSLRALVSDVRAAAQVIVQSSAEIASGSSDLSVRTERTAANLEESAASMEQMASTVQQTAAHAMTAAEMASGNAEVATRGGAEIGQVVDTMAEIHRSSSRIADIIGVIDGIAFQTNILALNAAVEAARAGEQGRGFAVVAGEVGALARRSATAAQEIKKLIHDSVEKVTTGAAVVESAGGTMTDIVTHAQRMNGLLSDIATAAREQSAGVAQVGQAVQELDRVTQENAALVEETAAASMALKRQAEALAAAVESFRLS